LFPALLSFGQFVIGGTAKTTQLPPKSLNGFGNITDVAYVPKHIAIPSPSVSVGATYNLNTDGYVPQGVPKKNPSVAHLKGNPNTPGAGIYPTGVGHRLPGIFNNGIPFPIVVLSVLKTEYNGFGSLGTQPKT
jgi:hypothetical protein